jgi:hypothetical protein
VNYEMTSMTRLCSVAPFERAAALQRNHEFKQRRREGEWQRECESGHVVVGGGAKEVVGEDPRAAACGVRRRCASGGRRRVQRACVSSAPPKRRCRRGRWRYLRRCCRCPRPQRACPRSLGVSCICGCVRCINSSDNATSSAAYDMLCMACPLKDSRPGKCGVSGVT